MTPHGVVSTGEGPIDILLIDDNADFLILIRRALESRDARYRVTSVVSPQEAEDLLDRRSFHLVLLDYRFPQGGNGLQVIRNLKGKATYVPTVMVTAFGDESLAIQAMREGALDFVPKTSDFLQALPDVVARAIERGRIIRERIATQRDLRLRNRDLQVVNEIATALNETRDPAAILAVTQQRLGDLLGAERVVAHQVDDTGRWLECAEGEGESLGGDRIDLSRDRTSAPARAIRERQVVGEADPSGDFRVVVPLVAQERAVGCLTFWLVPGRDLGAPEASLAASIGKQVGVALERARLWSTLQATQSYLQDLVDNAADEIVTIDASCRITSWNAGAEAIYGWAAREVVGRSWERLWPEDRRGEARDLARRVLEGQTVRVHETVRTTRDGAPVDLLLTLSPLGGPDAPVSGVSCVGKNVTRQKQLHAQLQQSEKMVAVGQLISGVAHELNNPLTSVVGYAQLIAEGDVEDKFKRYLETIASEATRCQRIVQNLLAFARRHEPRAARVDMNGIVAETVELRGYDVGCHGVELVVDLDPGLPTTLADPHQLQQVFVNLVSNAQHALRDHPGSPRLTVRTRLEPRGLEGRACIVVAFEDNGSGVPHALRRKIFDPFFTTKGVGEGTGLGLSLSYGIVEEHGGKLSVCDTPGGGARFEVRLPVMPEIAADLHAPAGPAAPRRFLLVDHDAMAREVVTDILRLDGHDSEGVRGSGEAIDLLRGGGDYDALIVDLDADSAEIERLHREVRATRPDLAHRFVFTGTGLEPEGRRLVERSGSPWLPKPFGVEDVRATVSRLFSRPGAGAGRATDPS